MLLQPNAKHQVRLEADARHERTLEAVTCMPFIGRQSCFQWYSPQLVGSYQ